MNDKALQKLLRLSDQQVESLRKQNGDWNAKEARFVPTAIPLLELVRIAIVDTVGGE